MIARPLAQILTLRLVLMASLIVLVNLIAVGVYYGSDRRAIEDEAISRQIARMEAALEGSMLPADAAVRDLYAEHPQAYAFALVNRGGVVLEEVNPDLIPPVATDIFADNWVTRLNTPSGPLIVAGHEFAGRTDGLRMVFVMAGDPAGLLQQALLAELYLHVAVPILPVVLLLLGANAWLIRRGLTPLAAAAAWARGLHPGRSIPLLPSDGLPTEVADLVEATQRSLDRLNEALEAETRNAAEAAHALRTPVAVLVARLDALPPGETTDRLRADLAALSRTVAQVLASTRADRLEVADGAGLDLRNVAQTVVAALVPFAHVKGVVLSLDQPGDPVLAHADAEGVEIALSNLIENAILHGGSSAVEVTVDHGPTITVRDHGPGLPQNAGAEMFRPFWRGPNAVPGGAGLGLAIVERVQRGQGGKIEAHTPEGGGCIFVLTYRQAEK
ncbi:HAMP domain-containing histidine kinase [Roseovarius sp. LXJ103]|uniref:sensor histidine kinase n=1 Tax=Roseovarius carneus TaxID=2853164 RepID=UPI000D611E49|nr:HAMP domain-containing sensor histidine kinase [Roseovarius carneus]MBZ8117038.1 HAMP domain-containing histidine kinase [Roseovarius carneus]PWE37111.1 sensor histidine kinase [Pelagicola sp. LXJ1103]